MKTPKRSTNEELNKDVAKIQQPVPEEKQFVADPAPVELVEPSPVPQPPLAQTSKEDAEANLKKQSGYDPKANQPSKEEKEDFNESQKNAK